MLLRVFDWDWITRDDPLGDAKAFPLWASRTHDWQTGLGVPSANKEFEPRCGKVSLSELRQVCHYYGARTRG